MYSDAGNTPSRVLGSPIRTPSDHSSFGSSPRLIAAYYVLHRLLVPRHPPCALTHLHSQTIKDARVHCAVLKQHTPTPPTPHDPFRPYQAYRESVPPKTTQPARRVRRCCFRHPTVCFVPDHAPRHRVSPELTGSDPGGSCAIVFHPMSVQPDPHSGPQAGTKL